MAGHLNGMQARIKIFGVNIIFVHCYVYSLNLVFSQSQSLMLNFFPNFKRNFNFFFEVNGLNNTTG